MLEPAFKRGSLLFFDLVLTPRIPVPAGAWGLGPQLPRRMPLGLVLAWASTVVGGRAAGTREDRRAAGRRSRPAELSGALWTSNSKGRRLAGARGAGKRHRANTLNTTGPKNNSTKGPVHDREDLIALSRH